MFETFDSHFDTDLIGPNGNLMRLHKGKAPKLPAPIPTPPPVRDSNREIAKEGESARAKAKRKIGAAATAVPATLLGDSAQPGRTLL